MRPIRPKGPMAPPGSPAGLGGRSALWLCFRTAARYNTPMTPEPTSDNQTKQPGEARDPIQAAADYGIDIAQLRDNLALPVAERLRRHQIALNTVEKLRKARRL